MVLFRRPYFNILKLVLFHYFQSRVSFIKLASIQMANNRYCIDLAKRGTAGCKNCNKKIDKGVVRIGKIIANPFTDSGGDMKQWFHVRCMFDKLSRARATTKKIESTDDLEGWDDLADEHKPEVMQCLSEFSNDITPKKATKKTPNKPKKNFDEQEDAACSSSQMFMEEENSTPTKDDTLRVFRKICAELENEPKYTEKTSILSDFFSKGTSGERFKGNLYLWVKMLLPAIEKRIYNLKATQLVKIFSKIFDVSHEDMLNHYETNGDVSETVQVYFEESNTFKPANKSTLFLQDVDACLDNLCKTGMEVEQTNILTKIAKKCTSNDLKTIVRFINHDLRINAGPKPILNSIHSGAYEAFQTSRNLKAIVQNAMKTNSSGSSSMMVKASLMTPVLPMLAMACKDYETAFKKCPKGFFVEIKYDGERVQLHKNDDSFSYFSRSLKPVMPHKVASLKQYIPKAFPHGNNLILDSEILLVDKDGNPLPFGTLGAHRKNEFSEATVCLFVFDCLHFNDENLMKKPFVERRKILEKNMKPIKNHVMFSELTEINEMEDLKSLMMSVKDQGLEGIVIKSKDGIYEPGKRHWLKMKKDYLKSDEGKSMADSADLVVLGAYYGTGKKGGKISVFLMGCYDERTKKWCTVTKVGGFTDERLDELQDMREWMIPTHKDCLNVPDKININKGVLPDFVVKDPKESPVWEISGAEYSKSEIHTANGISIRFPRVTRVRDDKDWKTATSLKELQDLYEASKNTKEVIGLKIAKSSSDVAGTSTQISKNKSEFIDTNRQKKFRKDDSEEDSPDDNKSKGNVSAQSAKKTKSRDNANSSSAKKLKTDVSSSTSSKNGDKKSSHKILPNIFTGVKLHIPKSVSKFDELRRYFIAYDGDLLKEDSNEATHVIINSEDEDSSLDPRDVERIAVDWLWDCIILSELLPTKMYRCIK